jgi:hypothetical protein
MSAAGRGKRKRVSKDFYGTPAWCVRRLLEATKDRMLLPAGDWLEPCIGDGAIVRAVNESRTDVTWSSCEIRDVPLYLKRQHHHHGDFLKWKPKRTWDVVITNPPFSLALEFVRKSLELAPVVAMLLRTGFLESETRNAWLREHVPSIYVLPNRPSFRWGKTDATTYAWMVWHPPEWDDPSPSVHVLKTTPLAERLADRRAVQPRRRAA